MRKFIERQSFERINALVANVSLKKKSTDTK